MKVLGGSMEHLENRQKTIPKENQAEINVSYSYKKY